MNTFFLFGKVGEERRKGLRMCIGILPRGREKVTDCPISPSVSSGFPRKKKNPVNNMDCFGSGKKGRRRKE